MRFKRCILACIPLSALILVSFVVPHGNRMKITSYALESSFDCVSDEENTDFQKPKLCLIDPIDILEKYNSSGQSLALSFKNLTSVEAGKDQQISKEIFYYNPKKYAFNHDDFILEFKEQCKSVWEEWVQEQTKPIKISLKEDGPRGPDGKLSHVRVGLRFVMFHKTDNGLEYMTKNATKDSESVGDISIPYYYSEGETVLDNVEDGWIFNPKRDGYKGPLTFEIVDYRNVNVGPISEEKNRVAVDPIEKRTLHLTEKVLVPFPINDLTDFELTERFKDKFRAFSRVTEADDIYFCYPFEEPDLYSDKLMLTKNKDDIGTSSTFAARVRYSGSIFYVPYKMHETKMKFRGTPTIYMKVPGKKYIDVYFNHNKEVPKTIQMYELINAIRENKNLSDFKENDSIKIAEKLVSHLRVFGKTNICLWKIIITNGNKSQSFLLEDYENFPTKNFFCLTLKEELERYADGKVVNTPLLRFGFSDTAIQLVRNMHYLHQQYTYIRDHILAKSVNPRNCFIIQKILNDMEAGKYDCETINELIDTIKEYHEKNETIPYSSPEKSADWYANAVKDLEMDLTNIKIYDWPRVLAFFANYLRDDIEAVVTIDGRGYRVHLLKNRRVQTLKIRKEDLERERVNHKINIGSIYFRDNGKEVGEIYSSSILSVDHFKKMNQGTTSTLKLTPHSDATYTFKYDFGYVPIIPEKTDENISSIKIKRDLEKERLNEHNYIHYYHFEFNDELVKDVIQKQFAKQFSEFPLVVSDNSINVWEMIRKMEENLDGEDYVKTLNNDERIILNGLQSLKRQNKLDEIIKEERNKFFYKAVKVNNIKFFGGDENTSPAKYMWRLSEQSENGSGWYLVRFVLEEPEKQSTEENN